MSKVKGIGFNTPDRVMCDFFDTDEVREFVKRQTGHEGRLRITRVTGKVTLDIEFEPEEVPDGS